MLKRLIIAFALLNPCIALADDGGVYKEERVVSAYVDASLKVISKEAALRMWLDRNQDNFLSQREIARIAFRSFQAAREKGVERPTDVSRVVGGLIRTYQGDNFELWRSKIGELYLLGAPGYQQNGFPGAILDFLGAIDFGGIAQIIAQIVAIIQLFL